jgi:hypothetical protein
MLIGPALGYGTTVPPLGVGRTYQSLRHHIPEDHKFAVNWYCKSHALGSSMGRECKSPFILNFIIMYMSSELQTRVTVRSVNRDLPVKATAVISSRVFTFFVEPQCLQQPPTGLYLSQLTAVCIFTSYLINTHFNIILPYSVCLRSCIFHPGFPSEKSANIFHFSDACYTPRLSSSLLCLP